MLNLSLEDKELSIAALKAMSVRQREAFLLWLAGFSQEESGAILGISQRAVGYRLTAAQARARAVGDESQKLAP